MEKLRAAFRGKEILWAQLGKTAIEGIKLNDLHKAQLAFEKRFKECKHDGGLEKSFFELDKWSYIECSLCRCCIYHYNYLIKKQNKVFKTIEIGKDPIQVNIKDDPRLEGLVN